MKLRLSVIALLLAFVAQADVLLFVSDSTNILDPVQFNDHGNNVLITPHPAWNPNGPENGYWISYDQTGLDGIVAPSVSDPIVLQDPNDPTAVFFHTFSLPYDSNIGILRVWADDTARVWMDDGLLMDANPGAAFYCTGGIIGCTTEDGLVFDLGAIGLTAGDHELKIEAYQRYGGPFGVQYAASIESTAIPEPATISILAVSLLGLWFCRRRIGRSPRLPDGTAHRPETD